VRWPTSISRFAEGLSGWVRLRQNLGARMIFGTLLYSTNVGIAGAYTHVCVFLTSLVFTLLTEAAVYAVVQLIRPYIIILLLFIPIDVTALLMGRSCIVL